MLSRILSIAGVHLNEHTISICMHAFSFLKTYLFLLACVCVCLCVCVCVHVHEHSGADLGQRRVLDTVGLEL